MTPTISVKIEDISEQLSITPSKSKSRGTLASPQQKARLQTFFDEKHYPTPEEVALLSSQIGLSVTWIQSWMSRTRIAKGVARRRPPPKSSSLVVKAEPDTDIAERAVITAPAVLKRGATSAMSKSAGAPPTSAKANTGRLTIKIPPLASLRRARPPPIKEPAVTISTPTTNDNSQPASATTHTLQEQHPEPAPPPTPDDIPLLPDPDISVPTSPASIPDTAGTPASASNTLSGAWARYQEYRQSGAFLPITSSAFSPTLAVKVEKVDESSVLQLARKPVAANTNPHTIPQVVNEQAKRKRETTKGKPTSRGGRKTKVKASPNKRIKKDACVDTALTTEVVIPPPPPPQVKKTGVENKPAKKSGSFPSPYVRAQAYDLAMSSQPPDPVETSPSSKCPAPAIPKAVPQRLAPSLPSYAASWPPKEGAPFQGLHYFMFDPAVPARTAMEVQCLLDKAGLRPPSRTNPPVNTRPGDPIPHHWTSLDDSLEEEERFTQLFDTSDLPIPGLQAARWD